MSKVSARVKICIDETKKAILIYVNAIVTMMILQI